MICISGPWRDIEDDFLKILSPKQVKKYLASSFVLKNIGVRKFKINWIVVDSGIEYMIFLSLMCFIIFVLFVIYEVVNLKKEVNKIKGIVNHLLKADQSKDSTSK